MIIIQQSKHILRPLMQRKILFNHLSNPFLLVAIGSAEDLQVFAYLVRFEDFFPIKCHSLYDFLLNARR